jgi:hypothetical protein
MLAQIVKFFKIWFEPKRLTHKDYFINTLLRIRFNLYRNILTYKIKNYSELDKHNYNLRFNDDFDSVSWDNVGVDKWKVGEIWGLYHTERPYIWYGEPILKDNGCASFITKYNPRIITGWPLPYNESIKIPYEISLISTHKFLLMKYGRVECRMTLPKGKMTWPAFWLWNKSEIDVIEAYGRESGEDTVYQEINYHYGEPGKVIQMKPWKIKICNKKDLGKQFHEFALEIKPDRFDIYTDGIRVFQYTNKKIIDKYINSCKDGMGIVINNSLSPKVSSNDGIDYTTEFLVDYLRVYDFKK